MELHEIAESWLVGFGWGIVIGTLVTAVRITIDADARRGLMSLLRRRRID